jgi:hypothetical protein
VTSKDLSPWAERRPGKSTLSVKEFAPQFAIQANDLALIANGLMETTTEQWAQRQLVQLDRCATEVETFLDDFGARRNTTFFRIRETVAVVRWLASSLSSMVHLHGRLPGYVVADRNWTNKVLAPRVREGALRLGRILNKALQGLREEWLRADLQWPDGALRVESLGPGQEVHQLPNDRLAVDDRLQIERSSEGARLANRLLVLASGWTKEATIPPSNLEARRKFMAKFCTEEIARRFEARIHNLQSTYDTLVAGSPEEESSPELLVIRGTASQALHLLEMVTGLTHLYERHDIFERHGESRRLFESLVDQDQLLETIISDGVTLSYQCLKRASSVAEALVAELIVQESAQLTLPAGLVMHARPLALIVGIVQKYGTPVEVMVGGQKSSAASMMQMLILVGSHPEESAYEFFGDGPPLQDISLLFAHNLGEDGLLALPEKLSYLRP